MQLAETLFTRLKKLHRLGDDWKPYLTSAALLHDIGEVISPTNHDTHSYYFAKNADFTPLEEWESEFIARLCLYHRVGKPDVDGLFAKNGAKEKERKRAFLALLALLRVADALDRNKRGHVGIGAVKLARDRVTLTIRAKKGSGDLELLRVEQKKALFESVFRRHLVVR
jgi:exopolyphosphatase/guanosine-5'-triphosphate,3'-diphosphate pyrophosphatase